MSGDANGGILMLSAHMSVFPLSVCTGLPWMLSWLRGCLLSGCVSTSPPTWRSFAESIPENTRICYADTVPHTNPAVCAYPCRRLFLQVEPLIHVLGFTLQNANRLLSFLNVGTTLVSGTRHRHGNLPLVCAFLGFFHIILRQRTCFVADVSGLSFREHVGVMPRLLTPNAPLYLGAWQDSVTSRCARSTVPMSRRKCSVARVASSLSVNDQTAYERHLQRCAAFPASD